MSMNERKVLVFTIVVINLSAISCTFYNVGVRYNVAANVYSGRDDPTWMVDVKHSLFNDVTATLNRGPPTDLYGGMGYRGFTVEATNAIGQKAWKTVGRHTNRDLEMILMKSCPMGELSPAVMSHIEAGIFGRVETHTTTISQSEDDSITIKHTINMYGRKKRQAAPQCATEFRPQNWNFQPVRRMNNCYNYATNRQTNTFAQPGRRYGRRYRRTTARELFAATQSDGMIPTGDGSFTAGVCKIYLCIWPGEDYHFLRMDGNGFWSQKSGKTEARNTDDSGALITDPRRANLGPYVQFVSYYIVPYDAEVQ